VPPVCIRKKAQTEKHARMHSNLASPRHRILVPFTTSIRMDFVANGVDLRRIVRPKKSVGLLVSVVPVNFPLPRERDTLSKAIHGGGYSPPDSGLLTNGFSPNSALTESSGLLLTHQIFFFVRRFSDESFSSASLTDTSVASSSSCGVSGDEVIKKMSW